MNSIYSLKFKLMVLCLLTIALPVAAMIFFMPMYYQNLVSAETKQLTENNLTSIVNNINTYLDDLERITISVYSNSEWLDSIMLRSDENYNNSDDYTKLETNTNIEYMLSTGLRSARNDIICSLFFTLDGEGYIVTKQSKLLFVEDKNITSQEWFKNAVANNGQSVITNVHKQSYLDKNEATNVFSVARLIKDPIGTRPLGVIMADADSRVLNKILMGVKFNVDSIVTILDSENKLIFSNSQVTDDTIKQIVQKKEKITQDNYSYTTVSKKNTRTNWNIVTLLSDTDMQRKAGKVNRIGVLLAVGTSVVVLFLYSLLAGIITNPFKKIFKLIKEVERGNLKYRTNITGKDVFAELGMSLDHMASQLDDLIEREYKSELSKRTAQFNALQSQINPHFLYNTLTGFLALNRLNEQKLLEESIKSLTRLLRYTLNYEGFVTIGEELTFLEDYCMLQKMRFDDKLEYQIFCEKSLEKYNIPKLLLQPLVENSIIHGIEPYEKECTVRVDVTSQRIEELEYIHICVQDDGAGFDMDVVKANKSIGIENVRERLAFQYKNSSFKISSQIDNGTKIQICIPIEEDKDAGDNCR